PAMDSLYQSNKAIASSLSALDLSDTLSAVSKMGGSLSSAMGAFKHFEPKHFFEVQELVSRQLQDIEEAYEEFRYSSSSLVKEDKAPYSVNNNQSLTEEDVRRIVNDMQSQQNVKKSPFKDFVRDILVSYGTDALKSLVNLVLLPLVSIAIRYLIENHYEIINAIQNSVDNGIYVIGYISAKKYIKEQGLTSYENVNRIGILRVSSKVRLSYSRHSAFSSNVNIPKDTIVNIIEKRRNWVKVEAQIEEQNIEGWIEESKVIKFKKEN
ncbi:hypothetical protein, partial [Lysinibacillus sp. NPDC093688]|uniref:hypothetical protein n=1 Tax=Lysinibacillus sp. NPDC093688 TaxID=3390577 RepID=UPI003CFBDFCE